MSQSFEWAPWVVLFSIAVFSVLVLFSYLGQYLLGYAETGRELFILYDVERSYRSFDYYTDYILLTTRFISFVYLVSIPIVYGTIFYEDFGYNVWFSFQLWNCGLAALYFFLAFSNSFIGLLLPEETKLCLRPGLSSSSSSSSLSTDIPEIHYIWYAYCMQIIFSVVGATSAFIVTLYYDVSATLLDVSITYSPFIFFTVELIYSKYTVRFNDYWIVFVYLFLYIFTDWIIVAKGEQDYFVLPALELSSSYSLLQYFYVILLNYLVYGVWWSLSDVMWDVHSFFDRRSRTPQAYIPVGIDEGIVGDNEEVDATNNG